MRVQPAFRRDAQLDRLDRVLRNARKPKPIPPYMRPAPESGRAEPNEYVAAHVGNPPYTPYRLGHLAAMTDHQTHELNNATEAAGLQPYQVAFERYGPVGLESWSQTAPPAGSADHHLDVWFERRATARSPHTGLNTRALKAWAGSRGYDVDDTDRNTVRVKLPPRKPFAPHDPVVRQAWEAGGLVGRVYGSDPGPAHAAGASALHGHAQTAHLVAADRAAESDHPERGAWEKEHRDAAAAHGREAQRLYDLSRGAAGG